MQVITKNEVSKIFKNLDHNLFFSVSFYKKDGTLRTMNCRMGVTKHLTPNPTRQKPEMPENMITVYDVQNAGYRYINCNTVIRISAEHYTYEVR